MKRFSKRFKAFLIGIALFLLLVYTTDYGITEIATSITLITAVYIGGETIRKSVNQDDTLEYQQDKINPVIGFKKDEL